MPVTVHTASGTMLVNDGVGVKGRTMKRILASSFAIAILVAACGGASTPPASTGGGNPCTVPVTTGCPDEAQALTGAGATFPAVIYTKWVEEYNKLTGVQINYQAVGSG